MIFVVMNDENDEVEQGSEEALLLASARTSCV